MAFIIADRVKEASSTTGTGVFTLAGAMTGARTFASALSDSDTCFYCIDDAVGNWEMGIGTYSANTLARTAVTLSSNAGSLVDFPAGAKAVFITNPAANIPVFGNGAFTPVVIGGTVAGAATYTAQNGFYQQVGKTVFVNMQLAWSAHTGSGITLITGLPLPSAADSFLTVALNVYTHTATVVARVASGATQAELVFFQGGGAITGTALDPAAALYITGSYQIA